MKKQLEKKLRRVCESAGSRAAAEKFDQLSHSIETEYDKRVSAGMSELDAYREMLRDIDAIEELLRDMPKTEEEQSLEEEKKARRSWNKKLNAIEGSVQGVWWLLTVIAYFLFSIVTGLWQLSWLMFPSAAIGSIIISMLFKYNKGAPKKRVLNGLHGILWLGIVIGYFLISFASGLWHLTWLLFIVGSVIEIILDAVLKMMD